jgi:23S rRNA (uracil1939-C5)-methyltransferase
MLEEVVITKLVHGGQGLATLPDGKKIFVWNALPGERVRVRILKSKRSYAEGIAEEILEPSPERQEPREENYLATSPWQILKFAAENKYKTDITRELFAQAGITLPDFEVTTDSQEWHYRNKMEYSFWGDDAGLHLALYRRGSHGKQIVQGSELALPAIDKGANSVLSNIPADMRAGELKTIIVRSSQKNEVVASLFVKVESFPKLELPSGLKGLRVYHSNPKSPASVPTKLLYELGNVQMQDDLLGKSFTYDVDSFFQVNVPVFELALARMKEFNKTDELVDMYAGVGSISLTLAKKKATLVDLDPATIAMARVNAENSKIEAEVTEVSTEKALEYIQSNTPIVFDPPRAGLHNKIVDRLLDVLPPQITYLSCNPATQARDIAKLAEKYTIKHFEVFNFFPHTPHIESLAILQKSV